MAKIFYDHLVVVEEVTEKLEKYDLDAVSLQELVLLIGETLHQEILDLILTHLPDNLHEDFLARFYRDPGDAGLLDYLKTHTGKDIEKLIKLEAQKVKREILAEIKSAKRK